jgi:RND family efflux transporter MFP subunit
MKLLTVRNIGLIATVIVAVYWLCSCTEETTIETANTTTDQRIKLQTVEVVQPKKRSFQAEILITGTAKSNQNIMVYARESGYVQNVNKDIGDLVKAGETIAVLSNPELRRLQDEKMAQLEAKSSIYERLQSTYKRTPAITPIQLLDEAEADYLSAKAALESVQDRISFLQIKAPFSGKITQRFVDHGSLVQNGLTKSNPQGLFELQEFDPIRVTVPLPECDVNSISKGQSVTVVFPELPGDSIKAKVSRIAGALNPSSKTMQVEIDIENPLGIIKPGMYAKVLMRIGNEQEVLSLPVSTQWIFQNEAFIMAVNDSVVERLPLRKGLANKDYMEILNNAIDENTKVIIQGKGQVQPSQKVIPIVKKEH